MLLVLLVQRYVVDNFHGRFTKGNITVKAEDSYWVPQVASMKTRLLKAFVAYSFRVYYNHAAERVKTTHSVYVRWFTTSADDV